MEINKDGLISRRFITFTISAKYLTYIKKNTRKKHLRIIFSLEIPCFVNKAICKIRTDRPKRILVDTIADR